MSTAVLSATEKMSDSGRWRFMTDLARRAAADRSAGRQIEELAQKQDFYPRRLALMAGASSGDPAIILAALTGASARLARQALKPAAKVLDDATATAVLPGLPPTRRGRFANACARRGRVVVQDAFPGLSPQDQARLAAYASEPFVASLLADGEFAEGLAAADWGRLARWRPDPTTATLVSRFQSAEPSPQLIRTTNLALVRMAPASPPAALTLLRAAAKRTPLANLAYAHLIPLFPAEIAALILADGREARVVLHGVDDDTRVALVRQRGRGLTARELRQLAPEVRQRLYDEGLLEVMRDQAGALPADVIGRLPRAARQAEGRRAWTAPRHLSRPDLRLPYLSLLAFDDAMAEARPYIADPEGEIRAAAYAAVIGAARYDRIRLAEVVDFVRARRNEQDPVRLAMLTALASLPPERWSEEHLAGLSEIIDGALTARDVSGTTLNAAARLVLGLAPRHMAFFAQELARVVKCLAAAPALPMEARLNDAQVAALTPHILPLVELWRKRGYDAIALSFLSTFGRRLRAAPALVEVLADLTRDSRAHIAVRALDALSNAGVPARVGELVPQLLRRDPSWINNRLVSEWLNRHRQDLLTEFLSPRVYRGLLPSGAGASVPTFHGGFHRWTAAQQAIYARALQSIAAARERGFWELRSALALIAAMPATEPALIEALTRLGGENEAVRDMGLVALGRLDGGRGVPALTEALGDDRGRIAIYALRQAILDMPAAKAMPLLEAAPLKKVTVAKEVARLAGEVGGEQAWRFLAGLVEQADLHRDVRIAVLRALWTYLERDAVWDLFAQAAGQDAAAARSTIYVPQDRLSRHARERLAQHMSLLLRHESPKVRLETTQRLAASPIAAEGSSLLDDLTRLLDQPTPDDARWAAMALVLCAPLDGLAGLAPVFAGARAPQALQAVVTGLVEQARRFPVRSQAVAGPLVDRLIDERRLVTLALRLGAQVLEPEAVERLINRASSEGVLHAGAATEAAAAAAQRRGARLDAIEPALAAMQEPAARRIGLAVLKAMADKQGWTQSIRARLEFYRADKDLLVAEAAALTFPPDPETSD